MAFDLGGLLQQYLGGGGASPGNARITSARWRRRAPELVGQGMAAAFRSNQTPPFGQMVAQLFLQANPQQQAGMLTQLLSSLSPAAVAALTNSGVLPGVLGQGAGSIRRRSRLSRRARSRLPKCRRSRRMRSTHPGIVDQLSQFYARAHRPRPDARQRGARDRACAHGQSDQESSSIRACRFRQHLRPECRCAKIDRMLRGRSRLPGLPTPTASKLCSDRGSRDLWKGMRVDAIAELASLPPPPAMPARSVLNASHSLCSRAATLPR